jgi:hypothetical protein
VEAAEVEAAVHEKAAAALAEVQVVPKLGPTHRLTPNGFGSRSHCSTRR